MPDNGRILTMNGARPTDAQGRVLKHNATIEEVYQIVAEETSKVNDFYLTQIPPYVARMIQDALLAYGLIVIPEGTDIKPTSDMLAEVEPPPVDYTKNHPSHEWATSTEFPEDTIPSCRRCFSVQGEIQASEECPEAVKTPAVSEKPHDHRNNIFPIPE